MALIRGVSQRRAVLSPSAVPVRSPAPLIAFSAALRHGDASPRRCLDMDGKAASHLFRIIFVIAGIKPWDAIV